MSLTVGSARIRVARELGQYSGAGRQHQRHTLVLRDFISRSTGGCLVEIMEGELFLYNIPVNSQPLFFEKRIRVEA